MYRLACLLLALLACCAQYPSPAADGKGEREDLLPTRVKWRTLPEDVERVAIDASGRTWFELRTRATLDELKAQVVKSCGLKAPWVAGARIVLFDKQGRIWLYPEADRRLLLGYDPKTGTWLERRCPPQIGEQFNCFTPATHESRAGQLYFADRAGLHVFAKRTWSYQSLHELNRKYKIFDSFVDSYDEPRFSEDGAGRVFVWTPWGSCGRTGTLGFFCHDGANWTQRLIEEVAPAKDKKSTANHLRGVLPLNDGRLLLIPESGAVFERRAVEPTLAAADLVKLNQDIVRLGDEEFPTRQAANERLARLGSSALPHLRAGLKKHKDPEIVNRLEKLIEAVDPARRTPRVDGYRLWNCRHHGTDRAGNHWVWCDNVIHPNNAQLRATLLRVTPAGKVLLPPADAGAFYPDSVFTGRSGRTFIALYGKGCAQFDGQRFVPITDSTQSSLRYLLGEDSAGRVYLTDERRVSVYGADAPEQRASLPTTLYDVPRNEHDVVFDSSGTLWALHLPDRRPGSATLSHFHKGSWQDSGWLAPPGERRLLFFMPIRNKGLILQDDQRRVSYFDGKGWHNYASFTDLVKARHAELVRRLDNGSPGRDFYTKLRVDAAGHIWVIEWNKAAVFDGKEWTDIVPALDKASGGKFDMFSFLFPLPGDKEMLAVSGLSHRAFAVSVKAGKVQVRGFPLPGQNYIESDYNTRSGLWLDSKKRLWLPRDGQECVQVTSEGTRRVPDTGFPRFEDRQGSIWFHHKRKGALVVLDEKGNRAEFRDDLVGDEDVSIAEDRPGSIWVTTPRGLLHLKVSRPNERVKIDRVKLYEKDVPKGRALVMRVDAAGALWFYGAGPESNYRLYRVQLPR